jgi:hypothetical protein
MQQRLVAARSTLLARWWAIPNETGAQRDPVSEAARALLRLALDPRIVLNESEERLYY